MSPGATIHSSHTAQQMRVAPKITRTSPGSVAPDTIWSHRASMVPAVMTASLPGSVPAAWPIGTTVGICSSDTPSERKRSAFQRPWVCRSPSEAVTPVSIAARPEMAWVATAWQGQ